MASNIKIPSILAWWYYISYQMEYESQKLFKHKMYNKYQDTDRNIFQDLLETQSIRKCHLKPGCLVCFSWESTTQHFERVNSVLLMAKEM